MCLFIHIIYEGNWDGKRAVLKLIILTSVIAVYLINATVDKLSSMTVTVTASIWATSSLRQGSHGYKHQEDRHAHFHSHFHSGDLVPSFFSC